MAECRCCQEGEDLMDTSRLKSVLIDIRNLFGITIYSRPKRLLQLFDEIAPQMKDERNILSRMVDLGIVEGFSETEYITLVEQKGFISDSMNQLIFSEKINPVVATEYLNILASVFELTVKAEPPIEIPKTISISNLDSTKNVIFDKNRYLIESQHPDFIKGLDLYSMDQYKDAEYYFLRQYNKDSALAGVMLGTIYYYGYGVDKDYDKALSLFKNAMNNGCPLGAECLAAAYRNGRGVPKDDIKADDLFSSCEAALIEMCKAGFGIAQYYYGFDLRNGIHGPKDEQKALYWLKKGMENIQSRAPGACVQYARMFLYGEGVRENPEQYFRVLYDYNKSFSRSRMIRYELGLAYYYGRGTKEDYYKAFKHFEYAASRDHARAQDYLGDMYSFGKGVSIDSEKARYWYEKAFEKDNAHAALQLGIIYRLGDGIAKDHEKAMEYLQFATENGYQDDAYFQIANIYLDQDSEYYDTSLGKKYMEKSAINGNARAQESLARIYLGGIAGIDEDDDEFVFWMTKAAKQGRTSSQRILGRAYIEFNSPALPRSYPDAIHWLTLAADSNDVEAMLRLAKIYLSVDEFKDKTKGMSYMIKAASILQDPDKNDDFVTEWKLYGDLIYALDDDQKTRSSAMDVYEIGYLSGDKNCLYDIAKLYFRYGIDHDVTIFSDQELLKELSDLEETQTSPEIAFLIGEIYYRGLKVPMNKKLAFTWLQKAVNKGSSEAESYLGTYYINDLNQYKQGLALLESASKKGSISAIRQLGLCYKNGIGVKKNRSKAKELLKQAADKGDRIAKTELGKFIF